MAPKRSAEQMAGSSRRQRVEPIKIASCCSGWCSELWAAKLLGLRVRPLFACDSDMNVQRLSHALWQHEQYFHDALSDTFMQEQGVRRIAGGASGAGVFGPV